MDAKPALRGVSIASEFTHRNRCSRSRRIQRSQSTKLGVHDRPDSVFTIHRNAQIDSAATSSCDTQAREDPAVFPVAALSQDDPEIYEPYELDDITEERHVLP